MPEGTCRVVVGEGEVGAVLSCAREVQRLSGGRVPGFSTGHLAGVGKGYHPYARLFEPPQKRNRVRHGLKQRGAYQSRCRVSRVSPGSCFSRVR